MAGERRAFGCSGRLRLAMEWLKRHGWKRQRHDTANMWTVPEQHSGLPEGREDDPPTYRLPGTPVSDDRGEDGNNVVRE